MAAKRKPPIGQQPQSPTQEWSGDDDDGVIEQAAPGEAAKTEQAETTPAAPEQAATAQATKVPMMPPYDENIHTMTPTPDDTHNDALPEEKLPPVRPAKAEDVSTFDLPEELPSYKKAIELRRTMEATPVNSKRAGLIKTAAIMRLRQHIFETQQGAQEIHIGAAEYGHHVAKHRDIMSRERIELIARDFPPVMELLEAFDLLENKYKELQEKHAQALQKNQQQQQQKP